MTSGKMISKVSGILLIAVFSLLILLIKTTAADSLTINMYERNEIENNKIILGEVGIISGEDPQQVQRVKNIVFGNAPFPGKSKHLTKNQVTCCLKQNGLDLSKIQIIAPDKTEIIRGVKEISREEMEKIILVFLDKTLPWEKNTVNVKNIRTTNKTILPKGKITYKVIAPPKTDYLGLTPLFVHFYVNGNFEKKAWVTVNIEVITEVVVTKKPLGRYKLITKEDICLKKMNLAKLPSDVINRSDDVLGKRTRRRIDSNVALRPNLIEFPPLVKRGDIVRIIVESDDLKVTALGKVKEKGSRGEMIKVLNVDSNKEIYARVLDSSSVKVDY